MLSTLVAAQLVRMLPRRAVSQWVGRVCDAPLSPRLSRAVVAGYQRLYRVDMRDVQVPSREYACFDEFFTRPLREGARPIRHDTNEVVSPSDGYLQCMGPVEAGLRITVKGQRYDLPTLLGNAEEAERFNGGQFAVVYLSPRDYHRVHAPAGGQVNKIRSIDGDLYPVNSIGSVASRELFIANRRVVVPIAQGDEHVSVVMVGAMAVGRISVARFEERDLREGEHALMPSWELKAGDELGAFHLGSTVVVLSSKNTPVWNQRIGPIRMGESLVRFE